MLQTQNSCGITRLPSAVGQVMITTGGVTGMFVRNFAQNAKVAHNNLRIGITLQTN
jgi:hypothetical protein